jgi:hypothetical protein
VRPVTDSFLATVRGAHQALFRATVVPYGQTGVSPQGTQINILAGDVTFDTKSDVNASLDLVTDMAWPSTSTSVGAPYGQEVFVERGVKYGNGTQEWVGLGYFRINTVEQTKAPRGTVRITGEDRMAMVRDARPIQPEYFGPGNSIGAVIDFIVGEAVPGLISVYDFDAYSTLLVEGHVMDDDRIKTLNEIVTAYGKVMYFDYQGRLRVRTNPTNTSAPNWTVDVGQNGVLCEMQRAISRDGVPNGVVARGEPIGDSPPVQGIVVDTDPLSPTYWNGPFGKVPRFFVSSFLTTEAQCLSAAANILAETTGLPYTVSLGVIPNPALEGWDVLLVKYDPKANAEVHVVDRITYSLAAVGPMNIATRKQFLT